MDYRFEKQAKPQEPWYPVGKDHVEALLKREMDESLVEEVLNEMTVHHMPVMDQLTGAIFRAAPVDPLATDEPCQCEDCHCAREVGLMDDEPVKVAA